VRRDTYNGLYFKGGSGASEFFKTEPDQKQIKIHRTKIFLTTTRAQHMWGLLDANYPYILMSFWYYKTVTNVFGSLRNAFAARDKNIDDFEIMVDSGSYSATVKGTSVDLDTYIEWLYHEEDNVDWYVNLDTQFKPEEGLRNWAILCANGLHDAIHVHHRPEPWKYWDIIADHCGEFGGLSPMPRAKRGVKLEYFTKAHSMHPQKKLHWFGSVDKELAKMFDVYSMDCSSADAVAYRGIVWTPWGAVNLGFNPNYSNHIDRLPLDIRSKVTEWFMTHGFELHDLRPGRPYMPSHRFRIYFNALGYLASMVEIEKEKSLIELPDPEWIRSSEIYTNYESELPKGWK